MSDSIINYYNSRRSDIFIDLEDSFGGPRTLYSYKMNIVNMNKWFRILKRLQFPEIIKKKQVFTRWIKLLGNKHKKSLVNYSQFHGLQELADYRDVKKSSAGLEGWKHYVHV